jgi:hypothetical protein
MERGEQEAGSGGSTPLLKPKLCADLACRPPRSKLVANRRLPCNDVQCSVRSGRYPGPTQYRNPSPCGVNTILSSFFLFVFGDGEEDI